MLAILLEKSFSGARLLFGGTGGCWLGSARRRRGSIITPFAGRCVMPEYISSAASTPHDMLISGMTALSTVYLNCSSVAATTQLLRELPSLPTALAMSSPRADAGRSFLVVKLAFIASSSIGRPRSFLACQVIALAICAMSCSYRCLKDGRCIHRRRLFISFSSCFIGVAIPLARCRRTPSPHHLCHFTRRLSRFLLLFSPSLHSIYSCHFFDRRQSALFITATALTIYLANSRHACHDHRVSSMLRVRPTPLPTFTRIAELVTMPFLHYYRHDMLPQYSFSQQKKPPRLQRAAALIARRHIRGPSTGRAASRSLSRDDARA